MTDIPTTIALLVTFGISAIIATGLYCAMQIARRT